MELKEGKISFKDLALWSGKSPRYFSNASANSKDKFFKTFSFYADYHFEGKKIIIDKVKYPTYTKAFDIIEEEFPKKWGNIDNAVLSKERIDTCSRVGTEIWMKNLEVNKQIKLDTAKTYTNRLKVQQYGHNYLDDYGTKGRSEYVWMNEDGTAPLDAEGLKIIGECAKEAYSSFDIKIAAIDDEYKRGYISRKERSKAIGEIDTDSNYERFIELLVNRLGFIPEKRTKLIDTHEW